MQGECRGVLSLSLLLVFMMLVLGNSAVPNSDGNERKEQRQGPDTRASVLCQLSLSLSLSLSRALNDPARK